MNRRGIMFLETIIGLFLIGLVVMTLFPIYSLTEKGFRQHKETTQMSYISETTIETLMTKNSEALDFLERLDTESELIYPYLDDKDYVSTVRLIDTNEYLWDLLIIVKESKGGEANVELKATIRK